MEFEFLHNRRILTYEIASVDRLLNKGFIDLCLSSPMLASLNVCSGLNKNRRIEKT